MVLQLSNTSVQEIDGILKMFALEHGISIVLKDSDEKVLGIYGDMEYSLAPGTDVEDILLGSGITESYSCKLTNGKTYWIQVFGNKEKVNIGLESLKRILPMLGAITFLAALAIAALYTKYITRSILKVSEVSKKMANLDFRVRYTEDRRDEIGILGENLNELSEKLESALDELKGNPAYTTVSNQFKALVKGEYGKTPVPVDPKFREKITGSPIETPYDTNSYKAPENPVLPEYGNVKLAENEQEYLLLELFPNVATTYLKGVRAAEYEAKKPAVEEVKEAAEEAAPVEPITGPTIDAPMGGKVVEIKVKVGDKVKKDDVVLVYEAMKMENDILSTLEGTVKRILVKENDVVGTNEPLIEFE